MGGRGTLDLTVIPFVSFQVNTGGLSNGNDVITGWAVSLAKYQLEETRQFVAGSGGAHWCSNRQIGSGGLPRVEEAVTGFKTSW